MPSRDNEPQDRLSLCLAGCSPTEGVHFFTRGRVVTSRWLDPSQRGINLGFPQNT